MRTSNKGKIVCVAITPHMEIEEVAEGETLVETPTEVTE